MSLFPVVSQLDAVDANYLTAVTQEGFLVHYHDLQRLDGPAPYDLEGGKHAKTSVWNQILHSPDRSSGFRSTTQRLIPDPFGKMKSTFSRKKIDQTPKVGSRSASGVFCDHWRNTRGGSTSRAMGPGYYDPPTRDRFGKLIGGDVGQEFVEKRSGGGVDSFHQNSPRSPNRGTAAFAGCTARKLPSGRRRDGASNLGSAGTVTPSRDRGSERGSSKSMNWTI